MMGLSFTSMVKKSSVSKCLMALSIQVPEHLGGEAVVEDPVIISKDVLVVGLINIRFSYQSSPGSSDVMFGMQLLAEKEVLPFIPGKPFSSSNRTWLEIFNRDSEKSVNLEGWKFDDGFDFIFPNKQF